jgi:hypothetical protein
MDAMSTRRFAFLLATGFTVVASFASAHEARTGQVVLMCPDRSLRASDIDLAVAGARLQASPAVRRQMLERARSVCAANLSRVTLIAPLDSDFGGRSSVAATEPR